MTQCETLLRALKAGERLTVAEALTRYGIYALSQRVGDLKRAGEPIVSRPVITPSGARVAQYFYEPFLTSAWAEDRAQDSAERRMYREEQAQETERQFPKEPRL